MTRILFVITSSENLGDLALCREWISDLGRSRYQFGFVLHRDLRRYIDQADTLFFYEYYIHVKDRILEAYRDFEPAAVIFASNSFWNLPGYFGAEFGRFILEPGDVDVPVLSFDPFEIGIEYTMHQTNNTVYFSPVPSWVWALRYMSTSPRSSNAMHFALRQQAFNETPAFRNDVITKWGGDPRHPTIFFPVSLNRWQFIKQHYPLYYEHLSGIFEELGEDLQIFILSPNEVIEFTHLRRVIQLPLLDYQDFHDLVAAADLYLTDSYISCIFNAFILGTPAVLLCNSEASRSLAEGSFLEDEFFPFRVFPYGLNDACDQLEAVWGTEGCYGQIEILDVDAVVAGIRDVLSEGQLYQSMIENIRQWQKDHQHLPNPGMALEAILKQHRERSPREPNGISEVKLS
ncbi:MAG: DUF6365 family protein [Saprospiraceae bacterium]|nr:DUF6365 family protein [Saprospiraceae bacterium]